MTAAGGWRASAAALSKRDDDVATLKVDVAVLKWIVGLVLAMQVAMMFKLFSHWH